MQTPQPGGLSSSRQVPAQGFPPSLVLVGFSALRRVAVDDEYLHAVCLDLLFDQRLGERQHQPAVARRVAVFDEDGGLEDHAPARFQVLLKVGHDHAERSVCREGFPGPAQAGLGPGLLASGARGAEKCCLAFPAGVGAELLQRQMRQPIEEVLVAVDVAAGDQVHDARDCLGRDKD